MTSLTLHELAALQAVAGRRSFRAAAAELAVSPSSLSHAVAAVEKRLGVRLFNRTTRSVSLTEAGEHFLARVNPALREIPEAVQTVGRFRDTPAGTLRLNASEGGGERILPFVTSFLARWPDMKVDIAVEARLVDIVAEGFDAGVRGGGATPKDMVALSLGQQEKYVAVASPVYLAAHGTPEAPGDLLGHDTVRVAMSNGSLFPWEFARRGEEVVIAPPARLTVGSPNLAASAARSGAGVAWLVERSVTDDLATGRLVEVLADWAEPFDGVCLYYPRQRLPSAGLAAFIEHVKAERRRG